MKRIIALIPQGLRLPHLDAAQQDGIRRVATQFALPMPGTIAANGKELVDGVVGDNFELEAINELGLPFEVIGLYQWDGKGALQTLIPLNAEKLLPHLPPIIEYDEEGNVIATYPPVLGIPANWSGWPVPEL